MPLHSAVWSPRAFSETIQDGTLTCNEQLCGFGLALSRFGYWPWKDRSRRERPDEAQDTLHAWKRQAQVLSYKEPCCRCQKLNPQFLNISHSWVLSMQPHQHLVFFPIPGRCSAFLPVRAALALVTLFSTYLTFCHWFCRIPAA